MSSTHVLFWSPQGQMTFLSDVYMTVNEHISDIMGTIVWSDIKIMPMVIEFLLGPIKWLNDILEIVWVQSMVWTSVNLNWTWLNLNMRYGLRFGQSDELNLRSSSRCGKFLKELDWTDWTLTSLKLGRDKILLEVGLVSYVWETPCCCAELLACGTDFRLTMCFCVAKVTLG